MIKPELLDTIEIEAGKEKNYLWSPTCTSRIFCFMFPILPEDASTFLQKSASNASSKVWLTGIQTGVSQNLFQEVSLSAFQSLVDLDLPTLQPNEYMKLCFNNRSKEKVKIGIIIKRRTMTI